MTRNLTRNNSLATEPDGEMGDDDDEDEPGSLAEFKAWLDQPDSPIPASRVGGPVPDLIQSPAAPTCGIPKPALDEACKECKRSPCNWHECV